MAAKVGSAYIDFATRTTKFEQDIKGINARIRRMHGDIRSQNRNLELVPQRAVRAGLSSLGKIAAGYLSISAAQRAITGSLDFGAELVSTADKIGVTTDRLQEFRVAAREGANVIEGAADTALQRFTRRLAEAAQGTGELKGVLEQYGIAATDANGRIRDSFDVLKDLAEATKGAGSGAEQLRISFKAFDTEGAQLVNLMRQGSSGLDEFARGAHETGQVLDSSTAVALANAETQLKQFGNQLKIQVANFVAAIAGMKDAATIEREEVMDSIHDKQSEALRHATSTQIGIYGAFGEDQERADFERGLLDSAMAIPTHLFFKDEEFRDAVWAAKRGDGSVQEVIDQISGIQAPSIRQELIDRNLMSEERLLSAEMSVLEKIREERAAQDAVDAEKAEWAGLESQLGAYNQELQNQEAGRQAIARADAEIAFERLSNAEKLVSVEREILDVRSAMNSGNFAGFEDLESAESELSRLMAEAERLRVPSASTSGPGVDSGIISESSPIGAGGGIITGGGAISEVLRMEDATRDAYGRMTGYSNEATAAMHQHFGRLTDGVADELTRLITTGEADFEGMIKSWASDLLSSTLRNALSQAFGLGGPGGGFGGGQPGVGGGIFGMFSQGLDGIQSHNQIAHENIGVTAASSMTGIQANYRAGFADMESIVADWSSGALKHFTNFGQSALGVLQGVGQGVSSVFNAVGSGGGKVLNGAGKVVSGAGSTVGGILKGVGSIFGGFFADGGRPPLGKLSVVGERGPELFVPDSAGTILPNDVISSVGGRGGGPSITQNITLTPGVSRAELALILPQVGRATTGGIMDALARGGSPAAALGGR